MITVGSRDKDTSLAPRQTGKDLELLGDEEPACVSSDLESRAWWKVAGERRADFQVSEKPERKGACEFMLLVLLIPL